MDLMNLIKQMEEMLAYMLLETTAGWWLFGRAVSFTPNFLKVENRLG